jgi:hypothetical protein
VPNRAEHLSKALGNEQFAKAIVLGTSTDVEWVVTVFFYAAIHLIESFLATKSVHSKNHSERNMHVSFWLRGIYREYRTLGDDSRMARYNVIPLVPGHAARAQQLMTKIKIEIERFT